MSISDKVKGTFQKAAKYTALGAVGLATIVGTFTGNTDSFSPLYNLKKGTSYGICIGAINELDSNATHYGILIGLVNEQKKGSEVNGLMLGGGNGDAHSRLDGKVNGAQIGIINSAMPGYICQVGIINSITYEDSTRTESILLGIGLPEKYRGDK